MIKETLKSICCNGGWCYGIFWGFDERNALLLTLKDAYCEEQMGSLIDNMLLQVHVLGGGIVGQAAFTKNNQWMFSDSHHERRKSFGSYESFEDSQDDFEFHSQFSMGIKTIALISVEPWGIVQLGSTHKIPQAKDFADQVKELFREMGKSKKIVMSENKPCSSDSQFLYSCSLLPCGVSGSIDQSFQNSAAEYEDFIEQNLHSTSSVFNRSSLIIDDQIESNLTLEELFYDLGTPNATMLTDFQAQRSSGLLTLDEFFQENDLAYTLSDSVQSSVTGAFGCNNEHKFSDKFFDDFGPELGCKKLQGWNETLVPVPNGDGGSKVGTSNSLFSQLGLHQLLHGTNSSSSCSFGKRRFEDRASSAVDKRRKIDDNTTWSHDQMKMKSSVYDSEIRNTVELNSKAFTMEPSSCVIDSSPTWQEKKGKKKAKAGTKPRPKDRQMIQDRLGELRELIPSGEKMSIDRLLERTIRHLNFMQSLTKHVETMKQSDKPKSGNGDGGGATWACEVGDQTMVCPLIVEDCSTPSQMLIKIICEEQGFYLEIVNIIRGFGLVILNGVMEVRDTKIWAHFIVEPEGNQHVTRHEIFSSLIHLLQMSGQSSANANDHFGNVISSEESLFNNHGSFPFNLADTLQCGSL
ncbi:hypothetical protein ACJIZ3_003787 [Penstemon smallii]|uniref:BHLH domain-containing protein n=1 Tax=Penstemon smallii TaxID=265156 RepID=A0ABD3S0A2_9LAMI